jgi:hypothetical protein
MHLNYKKLISEVNRFKRNLLVKLGDFIESIGEADKYIKASLEEHMWKRIGRGLRWCDNREDM